MGQGDAAVLRRLRHGWAEAQETVIRLRRARARKARESAVIAGEQARGIVRLNGAAFAALSEGRLSKGDALAVARLAGILAAKKTSEIVPLAHAISLDSVTVECELDRRSRSVIVVATASTAARTGVEMEALTAAAGACLAIYDMTKSLDRSIEIREIVLLEKRGGRSGTYLRPGSGAGAGARRS